MSNVDVKCNQNVVTSLGHCNTHFCQVTSISDDSFFVIVQTHPRTDASRNEYHAMSQCQHGWRAGW